MRVPRSQPPAYGSWKASCSWSSGPRNMMTVRVRRAAATSMSSRSSSAGGMISRSLLSGSQRVRTPIEASTSRMRLTSSMRARLRRVVRPRLSSAAQSRATAAFLEVLTSIEPVSFWPPTMRRCCGPEWPSETNSESRRVADPGEHLEAEVLLALLDAGDGALGVPSELGEVRLGHPLVASRVADESADPGQVGLRSRDEANSYMSYGKSDHAEGRGPGASPGGAPRPEPDRGRVRRRRVDRQARRRWRRRPAGSASP